MLADRKAKQIAVGLALICEMYNRRLSPELTSLYEDPDSRRIEALHKRLLESEDYRDREVGLWLGLVVETSDPHLDFKDLQKELEEMEYILTTFMSRVSGSSQRELNNWINHLANAAYSIRDGFWFDAKIDMNRAVESSNGAALSAAKNTVGLNYEMGLIQAETLKMFKGLKGLPVRLNTPADRHELVLEIQAVFLESMKEIYLKDSSIPNEVLKYIFDHVGSALRYSMRSEYGTDHIRREIEMVSEYLAKIQGTVERRSRQMDRQYASEDSDNSRTNP